MQVHTDAGGVTVLLAPREAQELSVILHHWRHQNAELRDDESKVLLASALCGELNAAGREATK